MQTTQSPSVQQLQRAVKIAEQIESLQEELQSLLGQTASASRSTPVEKEQGDGAAKQTKSAARKSAEKGKRTMPPEAREKIAAAQRARWAKQKR